MLLLTFDLIGRDRWVVSPAGEKATPIAARKATNRDGILEPFWEIEERCPVPAHRHTRKRRPGGRPLDPRT
jgi:hypothetical protein